MEPTLVCTRCLATYPEMLERCPRDGAPLCDQEDIERIGREVGSYRLEKILGAGGMGVVYLARHLTLDKPVAIKVLSGRNVRHKHATREMLREAQAASRIHHPHIVDVTDFGTTPEGAAFLVMEYLEGDSLHAELARRGRLPIRRLAHIAGQVAGALGAAHRVGIVHRDLKPENIFLLKLGAAIGSGSPDETDFVKVLDFGLAKAVDMEPSARTKAGMIAGTPAYMSPEQARGRAVDGRSDIYSLGVLLYRMATGVLPFKDDVPLETLMAHAAAKVIEPRDRCSAVDDDTNRVILRCLEKTREARFQTMEELALALRRLGPAAAAEPAPAPDSERVGAPRREPETRSDPSVPLGDKPTVSCDILERVFPGSLSGHDLDAPELPAARLTPWPPLLVETPPVEAREPAPAAPTLAKPPPPAEGSVTAESPAPAERLMTAAPAEGSVTAEPRLSQPADVAPANRPGPERAPARRRATVGIAAALVLLGAAGVLIGPRLLGTASDQGPGPREVTQARLDRGAARPDATIVVNTGTATVALDAAPSVALEPPRSRRPASKARPRRPRSSLEPTEPTPPVDEPPKPAINPPPVPPPPPKKAPPPPPAKKKIDIDWIQDPKL